MHYIVCFLASFLISPAFALVLDWGGHYQIGGEYLQSAGGDSYNAGISHNLHLKPNIKAYDLAEIHGWFYLAPSSKAFASEDHPKFYPQTGGMGSFGTNTQGFFVPSLGVRDLYLKIGHSFGEFTVGWKPHNFGMGIRHNSADDPFAPVYSVEDGGRGLISWKGVLDPFYLQPLLFYLDNVLFNLAIQLGYSQKHYGIEVLFQPQGPIGIQAEKDSSIEGLYSSYFGAYSFYETDKFKIEGEIGWAGTDRSLGGAMSLNWTPRSLITYGLETGISYGPDDIPFYFHPSFSSPAMPEIVLMSEGLWIDQHCALAAASSPHHRCNKDREDKLFSFRQGIFLAPNLTFNVSEAIDIGWTLPFHLSLPAYSDSFHGHVSTEVNLEYQMKEGVTWNSTLGVLRNEEGSWYFGFLSQASVSF